MHVYLPPLPKKNKTKNTPTHTPARTQAPTHTRQGPTVNASHFGTCDLDALIGNFAAHGKPCDRCSKGSVLPMAMPGYTPPSPARHTPTDPAT